MTATPNQIAETLLREFTRSKAIDYADKIAQSDGPLSADYAQAAKILFEGDPDFAMMKKRAQEAQPVTQPTRADVEKLCASLKGTTDAHFDAAVLRMEAAHLLNGHDPEPTRIGSAVKYLESLNQNPETCACNPRRHGTFYTRGKSICVYCRKPV